MKTVIVEGHPFPPFPDVENKVKAILKMKPRKGDVFISTFPKNGTTWVQCIIWEIIHDGKPPPNANEMMIRDFPFLEYVGPACEVVEAMPSPRTMKLHLPYGMTPIAPEAKYISVMRNPFDCCVSFYHQLTEFHSDADKERYRFDAFFEDFLKGKTPFGDYCDFVQSWYEQRDRENVLFLSYETLKADTEKGVLEIARFLGEQYLTKLEGDANLLERILKHSSFEYMKENAPFRVFKDKTTQGGSFTVTPENSHLLKDESLFQKSNFYRKGIVGSGKTELTANQWERLDQLIENKVKYGELKELMRKTKV